MFNSRSSALVVSFLVVRVDVGPPDKADLIEKLAESESDRKTDDLRAAWSSAAR
jgi:hypothetical protein